MPEMKGLTLDGVWQFLSYDVTLAVIFFCIYKGVCFIVDRRAARKKKRLEEIEARQPDLADKVSKKVLSSLEPRLVSIEKDLKKDKVGYCYFNDEDYNEAKKWLDNHDLILSGMQDSQKDVRKGCSALFNVILVASRIGSFNGESQEMKNALNKMNEYLTGRLEDAVVYNEGGKNNEH